MGKKYNSSSVQANTTTEDSDISVTVDNQDITTESTETVEETTTEELKVDTTDETKAIEEFVNAKSVENGPIYYIRAQWSNVGTQKGSYTDINLAIKECNKYGGYSVFNDAGVAIHVSTAPVKMSSTNSVVYAGKRFDLIDTKLFPNSTTIYPKGMITGTYYLYDAQLINGRYRIVDDKNKIVKGIQSVIGYVAIEEM
jgi:hypothetical protein